MKKIILAIIIMSTGLFCQAQTPKVPFGSIKQINDFPSKFVTPRNVDIWLPEGYNPHEKYAVLYMNDGQMLFDSTMTWNHESWKVAQTATKLMQEGKVRDFIVVGIWNIPKLRFPNYFPQKPYESLSTIQKDTINKELQKAGVSNGNFEPNSDNYLKFLVKELIPYINKHYSVYKDPQHTFIAGSSMGGLISWYAICQYPNVFGGAACMSTHWPGTFSLENNPIPDAFINYLKEHLPNLGTHKIYFDYGNKTLDAMYEQPQKKVDKVMEAKGYTSKDWITKFFPGDDHSEKSWSSRLQYPLEFLFGK
ncbi:MAG: esterase [Bacteroidales bacterium]|nr:esterase [Bacteroidales bacterium]